MAIIQKKAWFRVQSDIEKIETGRTERNYIEMCWVDILIESDTGKIHVLHGSTGITKIPLVDYPEVKAWVEEGTPILIDAAEREYERQKASTSDVPPLESIVEPPGDPQSPP